MSKPPTPQGISRLLAKAGFERAETIKRGFRRGVVSKAGYHVTAQMIESAVRVRWWPLLHHSDAETHTQLTRYADVISTAGWQVHVERLGLIVTAGEDTP
jgi:hypothetical protein